MLRKSVKRPMGVSAGGASWTWDLSGLSLKSGTNERRFNRLTKHLDIPSAARLWMLGLWGGSAPLCRLLVLLGGGGGSSSLLLQLLLLEPSFGNGQEEGAFEGVLFTVLACGWISVRQDIASIKFIPKSAGPASRNIVKRQRGGGGGEYRG